MRQTSFMRMKRLSSVVCCMTTVLLLSSCYSSTVTVGDMNPSDPAVEVATAHDAHFIGGLIGHPKREASDYVGDNKNYRVKQYTSFVDGLLSSITAGIYTPTTTKFYLPYGVAAPQIKKKGLPVVFGIRTGLNMASMKHDLDQFESAIYDEDISMKLGFNIGIILDIPVNKSFYIQPGLYYSQKGAKYEQRYLRSDYSDEFTAKLNYLLLPILGSYRYNITEDLQLQVNAGPFVGYDFSDTEEVDAGIHGGIGVLLTKHFYVGAGYEHGFIAHSEQYTRNLLVNIGYNF